MNPFFITVAFLSLMSILTIGSVKHFIEGTFEYSLYQSQFNTSQKAEFVKVKAALDELKMNSNEGDLRRDAAEKTPKEKKEPKKRRCTPLKIDCTRPPDNSRLNFYLLLFATEDANLTPLQCTRSQVAARLMRLLYENCSFFNAVPHAEYRILEALDEKKEKMRNFDFPDEMGSIQFENKAIQEIFYHMLKGGQQDDGTPYPSLLDFITFDKDYYNAQDRDIKLLTSYRTKINLFFASKELLTAVIQEPHLVTKLSDEIDLLWKKIWEFEKARKESASTVEPLQRGKLKKDLEIIFARLFAEGNKDPELYKKLFDFGLGEIGHILIIEDPETKLTIREKIPKIHKQSSEKAA